MSTEKESIESIKHKIEVAYKRFPEKAFYPNQEQYYLVALSLTRSEMMLLLKILSSQDLPSIL